MPTTKKPLTQRLSDLHEVIAAEVEKQLEFKWRVVRIENKSQSRYMATLESQTWKSPHYIHSFTEAYFSVDLIENGPVSEVVGTDLLSIPIHRMELTCNVWILSSGAIKVERHQIHIPAGVC